MQWIHCKIFSWTFHFLDNQYFLALLVHSLMVVVYLLQCMSTIWNSCSLCPVDRYSLSIGTFRLSITILYSNHSSFNLLSDPLVPTHECSRPASPHATYAWVFMPPPEIGFLLKPMLESSCSPPHPGTYTRVFIPHPPATHAQGFMPPTLVPPLLPPDESSRPLVPTRE